jgi:AcrR family transcriptional regulator
MSASSTVPLSSTDELLYFDVALKKGWIRPATQDRARQMCEKILVAALKLFARQGYYATNVSDITKAAGCSIGIFYKRFTDKEGLFYTLQYRHYELANRMLDRLVDVHRSSLATEEILHRFVLRTLENMVANTGFHKALVEVSLKDHKAWNARRAHNEYAGNRLMDFLTFREELPESQELREKIQFAVRVVFSTITNFVVLGPGPYTVKDERVVDNLAEFLVGFLHEEQERLQAGS